MTLTLSAVLSRLHEIFSINEVNVEEVRALLTEYKANSADWAPYAQWDPNKYTRNLVDAGNGKFNVMILCWPKGVGSQIHDHTGAHCFVKVLSGCLREVRFDWPTTENEMKIKSETSCPVDAISYMNDALGLHRMENASQTDVAVSLHTYIPPYDACMAFDPHSGKRTKCRVTFYSCYGKKVDRTKKDEQGPCISSTGLSNKSESLESLK